MPVARIRLKTTGVDHNELLPALLAIAVVTVAGQTRKVRHDGIAALGEMRLNSVDLPTLGRPTRANTGFT